LTATNANVAALMTFAAFLGLGFALPFLPIYVQELGVVNPADAAQWAGILIGLGPLVAGFLAPFWGGLADRHGYKKVALLALSALGFAQILAALAQSPIHVLVSRVLSGLFGGVGPIGLAMAAGGAAASNAGAKSIGKIQAAQILAAGFGPLLGGAMASSLGIRAAFWGASFSCLFAALVVGLLYQDPPRVARQDGGPSSQGTPTPLSPDFLAVLVFVVFFVNFASRSFTPILPGQLETFGVSRSALALSTGVLISVYSVAAAISSFAFGRMAVRRDPSRLLGVSLLFSLVAAVAMAYAPSYDSFLAVALVYGLVSGGSLTLGYTIGSRRFGEASRGAYFGRLSGAALVGGAVAPALAALVARASMERVYWMNAAIYAALMIAALHLFRDGRRQKVP
jgi:DHA1 family multidrug resistance protein-like MFS transporter